jgi:predicted ester cyclase
MQRGSEGLREVIRMLQEAFPDNYLQVEDIFAEGDKVAVRATWKGTHLGQYRGHAPTGRSFTQQQMHVFRIANGRWLEHWAVRDELAQLLQLGVIASPAEPGDYGSPSAEPGDSAF